MDFYRLLGLLLTGFIKALLRPFLSSFADLKGKVVKKITFPFIPFYSLLMPFWPGIQGAVFVSAYIFSFNFYQLLS